MKVGICWPMTMDPARQRELFLAWCRRADESTLSTIALGDRIAHHSQEPLISLAVAAGATSRVKLMTSVIALPTRHTEMFAKEVASLDVLSGGRFTLGVGISSRPQDFAALGVEWRGRAQRFERQVEDLKSIWAGRSLVPDTAPIGPPCLTKNGPDIVVGAITEVALKRAGRISDGIMTWSFLPDANAQRLQIRITEDAWREAGKPGRPRIIAAMYFCLGENAKERLFSYLRTYYGYSEETLRFALIATTYDASTVRDAIQSYADAGVEEILFAPPTTDIEQIDRLADLAAGLTNS